MKALIKRFARLTRLRICWVQNPSVVADASADFGLLAFMKNAVSAIQGMLNVVTAGTNTTLTAEQALIGVTRLTAGASGGFTITLPPTVQLLALLGPTASQFPMGGNDGRTQFQEIISFQNDGTGQTGTVTPGDANTTVTGTATVANNTRRQFMLTITGPATINLQNLGTMAL